MEELQVASGAFTGVTKKVSLAWVVDRKLGDSEYKNEQLGFLFFSSETGSHVAQSGLRVR